MGDIIAEVNFKALQMDQGRAGNEANGQTLECPSFQRSGRWGEPAKEIEKEQPKRDEEYLCSFSGIQGRH